MKQWHRILSQAWAFVAGRSGACTAGLVAAAMVLAPQAARAQWTTGSNLIYYNGGNVGIGTPSPTERLHLSNGNLQIDHASGGTTGNIHIGGKTFLGQVGMRLFGGLVNGSIPAAFVDVMSTDPNDGLRIRVESSTGGVERMRVTAGGRVGIGTTNPQYLLSVNGTVGAKDVIVTNTGWSDYVFRPDYRLQPLREVAEYIRAHRHLPDIPSEAEVKEKGVSVGEMQAKLLAKVEELTLHMIRAEEENRELRERIARLEKDVAAGSAAQ